MSANSNRILRPSSWERIASNYIESTRKNENRDRQQLASVLSDLVSDVRGLDVLDVGCGPGHLSGELASAGASVVGIDISSSLLRHARSQFEDVTFIEYDLEGGLPVLDRKFDLIIAHMVLMNLSDIGGITTAIRQYLKRDGRFVFTLTHPCFFYYESGVDELTGKVFRKVADYLKESTWWVRSFGGHHHYHRSLTYYFEHLRINGFAVTRFFEPQNTPKKRRRDNTFTPHIPVFVLIEAMIYPKADRLPGNETQ